MKFSNVVERYETEVTKIIYYQQLHAWAEVCPLSSGASVLLSMDWAVQNEFRGIVDVFEVRKGLHTQKPGSVQLDISLSSNPKTIVAATNLLLVVYRGDVEMD